MSYFRIVTARKTTMSTKKKVVVTGGLGYIGSHTVVELMQQGLEVVIIDNLCNSSVHILSQIEEIVGKKPVFYQIDLVDISAVREVFEKEDIDSVIHFAAHLLVNESVVNPLKYYRNNLVSLINLLEVMNEFSVQKLLFSSSCTVYGDTKQVPVTEETPVFKASSPYGATKIMGEQIIEDAVNSSPVLKSVLLRYFNPVGAHSSGKIGELSIGKPSHLFPIISQAIESESIFMVFGKDYHTPDGTPVRDYIHVQDLASAHVAALQHMEKSSCSIDAFNIGTGNGFSVLEIIREFENISKKKLKITFEERREGDVEKIWADSNKAKEKLNWTPRFSLEEMVRSCLVWENYRSSREW